MTTATIRCSGETSSGIEQSRSGCSAQYAEYSSSDVPLRMKDGAVRVERSPLKDAMLLRNDSHVDFCAADEASDFGVSVMVQGVVEQLRLSEGLVHSHSCACLAPESDAKDTVASLAG